MKWHIHINPRKPNFWVVHVITWSGFMLIDLNSNLYRITDTAGYLYWLLSDLSGFVVMSVIRYIYKYLVSRRGTLYTQILAILVVSVFGGMAWFVLKGASYLLLFPSVFPDFGVYVEIVTSPQGLFSSIIWLTSPVFGWSVGYFALRNYFNLLSEREKQETMRLDSKNAQLKMLRYQLNPHFLFNSMTSIQALIYKDAKTADLMLTELAELLRYTLQFNDEVFVTVRDEFEIIEKYLSVEKIRFDERLDFQISLASPVAGAKIICFITQPFVENAIKHGLKSNRDEAMKISISAFREKDWLVINILNSGRWRTDPREPGLGIANARERLQNAYEDRFQLRISDNEQEVNIQMKIPYDE